MPRNGSGYDRDRWRVMLAALPWWAWGVLALLLLFVLLPLALRAYSGWWRLIWPGNELIPMR